MEEVTELTCPSIASDSRINDNPDTETPKTRDHVVSTVRGLPIWV